MTFVRNRFQIGILCSKCWKEGLRAKIYLSSPGNWVGRFFAPHTRSHPWPIFTQLQFIRTIIIIKSREAKTVWELTDQNKNKMSVSRNRESVQGNKVKTSNLNKGHSYRTSRFFALFTKLCFGPLKGTKKACEPPRRQRLSAKIKQFSLLVTALFWRFKTFFFNREEQNTAGPFSRPKHAAYLL